MNILSLENVSKNFGFKPLFENASIGLEEGERVGIIGANGTGKTTLLRLVAGQEQPDTGRVVVSTGRTIGYLPQNPPFDPDQTVLDAVFEATNAKMQLLRDYETACHSLASAELNETAHESLMERVSNLSHQLEMEGAWDLETNARIVLTQLGITNTGAQLGTLSGGQRKRVALAHALVTSPDLLILDEPTNHLDSDTIAWLETYLTRYTGALLLVTHDRYFLDRVTQRILEIDHGYVQNFAGNYAYYLVKKEELEQQRAGAERKHEAYLRRELAWLKQGARARTTKEKARVDRAKELAAQPKEAARVDLDISVAFQRIGKKVIELEEISKSYDARALLNKFSMKLVPGDRIGIIGPNGSGKTTLLDIVAGRIQPDSGSMEIGQTVAIGYYDQETRELNEEQRVIDYAKEGGEYVLTADDTRITAGQMLEKFMFPPAMQYAPVGKLSGGERKRLYLLRILMTAPNVLLLDEPTNDLDIPTLIRLEEYLEGFAGCLIVVSHDRYFLDRTIDRVLRFEGNGIIREYPGNFSYYIEQTAKESEIQTAAPIAHLKAKPQKQTESVTTKLSFKERRELDELEKQIQIDEARKIEIEGLLVANSSNASMVHSLYQETQELDERLNRNMDRWAVLAERA